MADLKDPESSSPTRTESIQDEPTTVLQLQPNTTGHPTYKVAVGDTLTIGRNADLPETCRWSDGRISGIHCQFVLTRDDARVYDRSTNGVFVGGRRVGRGLFTVLQHGDVVQFTRKLKGGEAIEYAVQILPAQPQSRNVDEPTLEEEEAPPRKRRKLGSPSPPRSPSVPPPASPGEPPVELSDTTVKQGSPVAAMETDPAPADPPEVPSVPQPPPAVTPVVKGEPSVKVESEATCTPVTMAAEPPPAVTPVVKGEPSVKVESEATCSPATVAAEGAQPSSEPTTPADSPAEADKAPKPAPKRQRPPPRAEAKAKLTEKFDDDFTCGICHQLFYKPVSCLPCLHNFCAPCYSQWMERSTDCPQCREAVETVRRNHAFAALVENWLEMRPSKKRTPEQIEELEKVNKITEEMLRIKPVKKEKKRHSSEAEDDDDEYDDEYEEESEEDEDEDHEEAYRVGAPHLGHLFHPAPKFGFHGGYPPMGSMGSDPVWRSGFDSMPKFDRCRACTAPDTRGFQCGEEKKHQMCVVCNQWFPLRLDISVPTRCALCQKAFCDVYWGCRHGAGSGILSPLKDHSMEMYPDNLFDNQVEKQILIDHTRFKGLKGRDVWAICMASLGAGKWIPEGFTVGPVTPQPPSKAHGASSASSSSESSKPPDDDDDGDKDAPAPAPVPSKLAPDTICCRRCATSVWRTMLFEYRISIPQEEFPSRVTDRPYCWYGKSCRTQGHNVEHCKKFNHMSGASKV